MRIQSYPGNEAPASGSWDIVYGGSVIASSTNPNGWQYHVNWDGLDQAQLELPITAVVGTGYKLRRTYSTAAGFSNYSVPFMVAASDLIVNAGVKNDDPDIYLGLGEALHKALLLASATDDQYRIGIINEAIRSQTSATSRRKGG